jgi:hypothetical protein
MIIESENGNQFKIKVLGINNVIRSILWEEKNELFYSPIHTDNNDIDYCIIHSQNLPLNVILKSQ